MKLKERYINILHKLMYIIITILIILTLLNFVSSRINEESHLTVQEKIQLDDFINNSNYEVTGDLNLNFDYLAIFKIEYTQCKYCIESIKSYVSIFKEVLTEKNIKLLLLVSGENEAKAKRFAKINPFGINALCGYDKKYDEKLSKFGDDEVTNQLVIIDKNNQMIIKRILLIRNDIKSRRERIKVLKEIFE